MGVHGGHRPPGTLSSRDSIELYGATMGNRGAAALGALVVCIAGCASPGDRTTGAVTSPQRVSISAVSGRLRSPPPLGHRTKRSGCRPRGQLPDPRCTPGAVIASAGRAEICRTGYTRRVRNVPEPLKRRVFAEYGIRRRAAGQYEVDHLVALELGGSNAIANLWPQVAPGYGEKDTVENELHRAVCSGRLGLRSAQVRIARDWRSAGVAVPPPSGGRGGRTRRRHRHRRRSQGRGRGRGSDPATAGFCASHRCIPSFARGRGTIVQCRDGQWSHSGGRPGVCSGHGGPRG